MGEADPEEVEEVEPEGEGDTEEEEGAAEVESGAPNAKSIDERGAASPSMLKLDAFSSTARSDVGTAQILGHASVEGKEASNEWCGFEVIVALLGTAEVCWCRECEERRCG